MKRIKRYKVKLTTRNKKISYFRILIMISASKVAKHLMT